MVGRECKDGEDVELEDMSETPRDALPIQRPVAEKTTVSKLLDAAIQFADAVAARPNTGDTDAPIDDLRQMAVIGLLTAPLPVEHGGHGLGTETQGHLPLLRLLSVIGGADLVLGRLYEGHVNALVLICTYGTRDQIERAAQDAHNGFLFGVWNTGGPEPLRLASTSAGYQFRGIKTFASGAPFVRRPIVTAELEGGGWQMTVPRMESPGVAKAITIDPKFWHPLGMEGSESYGIDFTDAMISQGDLIGAPGDFYRDPMFRGGAVRFAAVHAGAILRLHRMFAEWLESKGRGDDAYQVARLGEVALRAQEAALWIERAALVAKEGLASTVDKLTSERMIEVANMTRLAIERAATATMQHIITGVGAHGLLQPSSFERIIRNLTMYLRQPAPDQTLADVGRASLRKNNLRADGAGNGLWTSAAGGGSLPPKYFTKIYDRSLDPWNFEQSDYEAAKYRETLASLPMARYGSGLEVGCSIGVLSEQLGRRCDRLVGVDVSERALAAARERCAWMPHVDFKRKQVPGEMPEGCFDLIVVSEVAYYWSLDALGSTATALAKQHLPGGHLVLVHLTDPVPDYPLTGDQVHDFWLKRPEWKQVGETRRSVRYRLDVLERVS